MTAQGHPRAIYRKAIENGNLLAAETVIRELGQVTLEESLALVGLVAVQDPPRHSRYAVRWLRRLLEEHGGETALAVSALAALGGPATEQAQSTLSAMAERATSPRLRGFSDAPTV